MRLSFLEEKGVGCLLGNDCDFESVSTDTRTIKNGDVFVALIGPNFDAHSLLEEAEKKGACALVVQRDVKTSLPTILVDNTTLALGKIAHLYREGFSGKVITITGSCGKTTARGMLQSICEMAGTCVATTGNLNNQIGVPLTLFNLRVDKDFAVVEAGTSEKGEIGYLSDLIAPDVAVALNVMPAHVEGFGSLGAIALEKADIYQGLKENGTAIVNLDDENLYPLIKNIKAKKIGFTLKKESVLDECQLDSCVVLTKPRRDEVGRYSFEIKVNDVTEDVKLKVLGAHNLQNAAAVTACAWAAGIDLKKIKKGLESYNGSAGRMQIVAAYNEAVVIDDTYNANPGSMKAAIDYLSGFEDSFLICGDMAELGSESHFHHQDIGLYAKNKGIKHLYSVGDQASATSESFGAGHHFGSKGELADRVKSEIDKNSVVLVKGSRSAKMETVVEALVASGEH